MTTTDVADRSNASSQGPKRKPPRLLAGFWRLLTTTKRVTWGEIIIAAALIGVLGLFLLSAIDTLKSREVERVRFETAEATYQSDLRAYDAAVRDRAICIDGVERSNLNREQWELEAAKWDRLVATIAALDSGNGRALELAEQIGGGDTIRTGPVLSNAARSLDDCPVVPPVPTAPTRRG